MVRRITWMKALILSNNGMGLYKFRKELIIELLNKNYEVTVAFPKDEYVKEFVSLGCRFINTNVDRRGVNPIKDIALMIQYIKLIIQTKPDIVLTYTIKPNIYGGIACQLTKTKYLSTITGLGTAVQNKGILRVVTLNLYKLALRRANCTFFQNEKNKEIFENEEILRGFNKVVPGSGVNVSEFQLEPYPKELVDIELIFIGRIMKDKGINELLIAIRAIKEKYSRIQFSLIGICEEEYHTQLKEMEDQGLLNYYGKQNDVQSYIKRSHAIILPSYHEGLSNVLLEAASSGRPILASDIPGCQETFDENISGISFRAKDSASLIRSIEKFLNLTHLEKEKMGFCGRSKIVNEFDRNIVVTQYISEIEKMRCE